LVSCSGNLEAELDEDCVENGDETLFFVNMDNRKTLAPAGDKAINYAYIVSGCQGMTMFVRLVGSCAAEAE
jgi:hypothetical protein